MVEIALPLEHTWAATWKVKRATFFKTSDSYKVCHYLINLLQARGILSTAFIAVHTDL